MDEKEKERIKKWKVKIPFPEEIKHLYSGDPEIIKSNTEQDPSVSYLENVYRSETFYIPSGRLVLTTEGEFKYAFELIWNLPKGTYNIEFGKMGNYDIAFIKFREQFEDVYQIPVFFSVTHPERKAKSYFIEISGTGSQLLLVDKEIWNNEKSSIYSKDPKDLELFQIKYKYLSPSALIITNIPSEYSDNVVEDYKTKHEYFASIGFNRNGEVLFLIIQRQSDYQHTNKI